MSHCEGGQKNPSTQEFEKLQASTSVAGINYIRAISLIEFERRRLLEFLSARVLDSLNSLRLQPHDLCALDIRIGQNRLNDRGVRHRVEVQDGKNFASAVVSA